MSRFLLLLYGCGTLSLWKDEPQNNKENNGFATSQSLSNVACILRNIIHVIVIYPAVEPMIDTLNT